MKVLIGCEESGKVRDAFIERGHDAISCDLLPTRSPGPHRQGDIFAFMESFPDNHFDLIILHPDCTALTVAGNRWYGRGKAGHGERIKAIESTLEMWALAKRKGKRAALENPVGVIFPHIKNVVQYVQPWQFGHGETKKTGLALYNLPPLTPTYIVEGREQRIWKMPPGENRKRDRSETYSGIADAFADQWGALDGV